MHHMSVAFVLFAACRVPWPDTGQTGHGPVDSGDTAGIDTADTGGADSGETGDSADTADTGPRPLAGNRGVLVALDWGDAELPLGAGAGHYRVILLQESMASLVPEIRAANPEALLLAYQKSGGMREGDVEHSSTGIRVEDAEEAWFLHDLSGNRLEFCDRPGSWAADVGNPAYQAAWLAAVRERVTRDGYDGVLLDDANLFPGHCMGSLGTPIAEYATDEAYGDATVAFLAAVGPELQAAGLAVAPNLAMNPWNDTQFAQAVATYPYITHHVREYWMRWDDSANFRGDEWDATAATLVAAEAAGVGYIAVTYGPGTEGAVEGQRYGRASFLLHWNGEADSAWGYWGDGEDPWGAEWEPDLGLPMGEPWRWGGAWVREYTGGIVLANPSEITATVDLGGVFVDAELGEMESIKLAPGYGRVLARP